jgi:hypothetical protein
VRRALPIIMALVATLTLAACTGDDDAAEPTGPFAVSPTEAAPTFSGGGTTGSAAVSPTPPAIPGQPPKTKGAANATCVQGWVTPPAGTPMFTDPLGLIRRTAPVAGDFRVVDMRMFVGPESPPSVGEEAKGYLQDIRRWYIKLFVPSDLTYQGRFIVEQRVFGRGVSAVAPYDSEGFSSPDWSGFQFDSAKRLRKPYPGLPGAWSGIRYDFVRGGAGLTIPGLPDEVTGCLDGT